VIEFVVGTFITSKYVDTSRYRVLNRDIPSLLLNIFSFTFFLLLLLLSFFSFLFYLFISSFFPYFMGCLQLPYFGPQVILYTPYRVVSWTLKPTDIKIILHSILYSVEVDMSYIDYLIKNIYIYI
jgi:hypothetical protein